MPQRPDRSRPICANAPALGDVPDVGRSGPDLDRPEPMGAAVRVLERLGGPSSDEATRRPLWRSAAATRWPIQRGAYTMGDAQWEHLAHYRDLTRYDEGRMAPLMRALHARLLGLGGLIALLPINEDDVDLLLARGEVWAGRAARFDRGAASRCHGNAAELFDRDPERYRVVTGYALSEDGIWRQHSWALDQAPPTSSRPLIETTEQRLGYFGVVLTREESRAFYWDNA